MLFQYATKDELNTLKYFIEKDRENGTKKAEEYYYAILENLEIREGQAEAEKNKGNVFYGLKAGWNQFTRGLENIGNMFSYDPEGNYVPLDSTQVAGGIIREDLGGVGQFFYDVGSTVTNVAPSMLLSAAVGLINPTAGAAAGGVLMGATAAGNAYEEKIRAGWNRSEARAYGALVGISEAVLESVLGAAGQAVGKGGKQFLSKVAQTGLTKIDDVLARVSKTVAGKLASDALSEGTEEFIQSILEPAIATAIGGEEFTVDMEESLYSALLGAVTGAGFSAVNPNTYTGNEHKTSKNEKTVLKAEVDARVKAQEEKLGRELTAKETDEIKRAVRSDLDKGYVTTDRIEEALGGKSWKQYQEASEREKAVLKDLEGLYEGEELKRQQQAILNNSALPGMREELSRSISEMVKGDKTLHESYLEKARRSEKFTADVSKYKGKQAEIVQKAIDSGVLNNTNRSHELVDFIAKIGAAKDIDFDFVNNEKLRESGFAIEGAQINGYVGANGIAINVGSQKALNSVVGHEIAHVLEGSGMYNELAELVKRYANAKTKDGYNAKLKELISLYQNVEGYKGAEGMANIHKEVVADLIGDYLFTDEKFLKRLLQEKPNIFRKLWNEIKYLATMATGTVEAKRLAEVQKAFETVYRSETKNPTREGEVKYRLSDTKIPSKEDLNKKNPIKVVDISEPKTKGSFAERRKQILNDVGKVISKPYFNKDTGAMIFLTEKSYTHAFSNSGEIQLNAVEHLPELVENAVLTHAEKPTHGSEYTNGVYTFFAAVKADQIRPVKLKVKEYSYKGQELPKNIKAYFDSLPETYAAAYDTVVLEVEEIEKSPTGSAKDMNQEDSFLSPDELSTIKIADLLKLVKGEAEKYIPKQMSSDSDGRQLTEEQVAYFKDSKARDDNGNLLVMYHGSPFGVIHVFDPSRSDDKTSIFFTDSPGVAETYSGEDTIYEAQAVQTIDELNRYLAELDKEEDGLFVEKSGNKYLFKMEDGYVIGQSESLQGIYDVCWDWLRGGYGVNNKVYLNLTNPFVVDAAGKDWSDITYYEDLPEALKSFYPNGLWRRGNTREIAQYAKEHGYDGVIFKNVMDNGGFITDTGGVSTVAVAFDSNQIKSVRNTNPTSDPDVRYSVSEDGKTEKAEGWQIKGEDVLLQQEADANGLVWENGIPFRKDLLELERKRRTGEFQIAPPVPESAKAQPETAKSQAAANIAPPVPGRETASTVAAETEYREEPTAESWEDGENIGEEGAQVPTTVRERTGAKLAALRTELSENQRHRQELSRDFDEKITKLQERYAAMPNKTTKEAQKILRRILLSTETCSCVSSGMSLFWPPFPLGMCSCFVSTASSN